MSAGTCFWGRTSAILAGLVLLGASWSGAAPASRKALLIPQKERLKVISEGKEIYQEVRALIRSGKARRVSFSKEIDKEKRVSPWIKGRYRFTKKTVATADVYLWKGKARAILEYDATSLGAWRKRTEHYFREDGTLAYLYVGMVAAYYEVRIEMRDYYDSKGEMIEHFVAAFDIKTAEKIHDPEYVYDAASVYLSVSDFEERIAPLRILEESDPSGS